MSDIVIRSLGFYQPFGSLMLHGKIETRWVRSNRMPPFPKGRYLFYTTLKKCDNGTLFDWCGAEIMSDIIDKLKDEPTAKMNGYAIAVGDLIGLSPMLPTEEKECYVKHHREVQWRVDKNGIKHPYMQWCLVFNNVRRIEPFEFTGKQGVGILTSEQKEKIIYQQ